MQIICHLCLRIRLFRLYFLQIHLSVRFEVCLRIRPVVVCLRIHLVVVCHRIHLGALVLWVLRVCSFGWVCPLARGLLGWYTGLGFAWKMRGWHLRRVWRWSRSHWPGRIFSQQCLPWTCFRDKCPCWIWEIASYRYTWQRTDSRIDARRCHKRWRRRVVLDQTVWSFHLLLLCRLVGRLFVRLFVRIRHGCYCLRTLYPFLVLIYLLLSFNFIIFLVIIIGEKGNILDLDLSDFFCGGWVIKL